MMKTPKLPEIKGIMKLSLLQMNGVAFDKHHTVLTPEVLKSITQK